MTSADEKIRQSINNILINCINKKHWNAKYIANLSEEQLKVLKEFKEYYENKPSPKGGRIRLASVWAAILCLRRLGLHLKKPYKPQNEEEIKEYREEIVKFVNSLENDSTRSNWKVIIRFFYKWLYGIRDKHKYPEVVVDDRLKPETVKTKKKPSDLPTVEDIEKMLNVCTDDRDKAIVMIWTELGGRCGEIANATISDVEFDNKGCKLWIDKSKSERRTVRLVKAAPYLRNWVGKSHPDRDNPSAQLFVSKSQGGHRRYGVKLEKNGFNQIIKKIAKRAGIKKRIYWHLGRFFTITNLQRRGFDLVKNAKRHGITTGTLQGVYLQLDDKDIDDAYCDLENVRTEEDIIKEQKELDRFKPKTCPKCNHINPCDLIFCEAEVNDVKCNAPLDLTTAIKIDEEQEVKDRDMKQRIEQMEQTIQQISQQLQQPVMTQHQGEPTMASASGLQIFGQQFKPFDNKKKNIV